MKYLFFSIFILLITGQTKAGENSNTPINPSITTSSAIWAENKGQWNSSIAFRAQKNGLDLHLGKNFLTYYFYDENQIRNLTSHISRNNRDSVLNIYALDLAFKGSTGGNPVIKEPEKLYLNFYQGSNPSNWKERVRTTHHAILENLYPGIDLDLYLSDHDLKYEYHLDAFTNPKKIAVSFQGALDIKVEYGDLYIYTKAGIIKERKPYSYQYINGHKVEVNIEFSVHDNEVNFVPVSDYNPAYPLVIDPEIIFLTYSGSTVDNFGCSATPGENGTMYAAGISTGPYSINPTGSYPATSGAFQLTYAGGGFAEGEQLGSFPCDITFSKYSSDGRQLLYATYLGGTNNEIPHSLVVDKDGNLIVFGNTYSSDFPVTKKAFDTTHNKRHDIILSKFSSSGSMLASTYFGGSNNDAINFTSGITNFFFADSYRGDVITDSEGNILVASVSQSSDFPVTSGAMSKNLKGFQDGVVFKFSPLLDTLRWSTYLGGDEVDALYSIDLAPDGTIYLAGGTSSQNFPGTVGNFQPAYGGGQTDGFIAILNKDGTNILHSTYFGTSAYDQIFSLELDRDFQVYVVGQSLGSIEVTSGKYSNPGSHQFLACFSKDLDTKVWSTVFGSGRIGIDVTINAFLVDDCNRIYISSWGGKLSERGGSTFGLPVTPDAFQNETDGSDFYLILLNKNASGLLYATFLGGDDPGNEGDHVDGGTSRFDKKGVVYQSLCASCPAGIPATPLSDLKTTSGSFAPNNLSPRCSNAALKFDFRIKQANFSVTADTCKSVFSFQNKTPGAGNFLWIFPDGDSSTLENPVKELGPEYYNDTILMIVEYGTTCADSAFGFVSLPDTIDIPKIPNVFSPNQDGINDFFEAEGITNQCSETTISIYNRWGQLYYESTDSHFRWDGKNNAGIEAPEGIYFYMFRTRNKFNNKPAVEFHGTVSLFR